jgi:hypothetical protein
MSLWFVSVETLNKIIICPGERPIPHGQSREFPVDEVEHESNRID